MFRYFNVSGLSQLDRVRLRTGIGQHGLRLAAAAFGLLASATLHAGDTVFWIANNSNILFDRQVVSEISGRAGLVVLRSQVDHPDDDYDFPEVVKRLKSAGSMPVLAYGFSSRRPSSGRVEATILKDAQLVAPPLARDDLQGSGETDFIDVTNPDVRREYVQRYVAAKRRLGVDGFALDLSTRTPTARPAPLANLCKARANFCQSYAAGMDAVFRDLRAGLGDDTYLAYNGLFNNNPGQIADQVRLLDHTNAAAIEFFGMDPKESRHSFREDIQPFLEGMTELPKERAALVFARGPWSYTDYAQDYRWQRYLYGAYLLAARGKDMFKYHATFQVPTLKGRAGGIDYYADWDMKLGAASGPSRKQGSVWVREFEHAFVAVAPDDGPGGTATLPKPMYTPEGQRIEGAIQLRSGESVIVVDSAERVVNQPSRRSFSAETIGSWKWEESSLTGSGATATLELRPLDAKMIGEHDLLLDGRRSMTPFTKLEISVRRLGLAARVFAIAEVDDSRKQFDMAIVEIGGGQAGQAPRQDNAMPFRSGTAKEDGEAWPTFPAGPLKTGAVVIDGPRVFEGSRFQFRRWSHLRFAGPLSISDVALSQPMPAGKR